MFSKSKIILTKYRTSFVNVWIVQLNLLHQSKLSRLHAFTIWNLFSFSKIEYRFFEIYFYKVIVLFLKFDNRREWIIAFTTWRVFNMNIWFSFVILSTHFEVEISCVFSQTWYSIFAKTSDWEIWFIVQ